MGVWNESSCRSLPFAMILVNHYLDSETNSGSSCTPEYGSWDTRFLRALQVVTILGQMKAIFTVTTYCGLSVTLNCGYTLLTLPVERIQSRELEIRQPTGCFMSTPVAWAPHIPASPRRRECRGDYETDRYFYEYRYRITLYIPLNWYR